MDLGCGMSSVSVAIATFNRSAMVAEAVAGALGQSRAPSEVVVSDDASTDETPSVLQQLSGRDPRVRVLRQQSNSGGVENWNRAMQATTGAYIAWCSDDDVFEPGHLQASLDYLERHPAVDLVHSSFADRVELPAGGGNTTYRPLRSPEPLLLDHESLLWYMTRYYNWPFHPSTMVMRRKVWECTGPFDPSYALADTDWFVRAGERFSIVLLPRHGVLNRRHAGNWSNRLGSARMQAEIFEIVEGVIARRWPSWSIEKTLWRAIWRTNARVRLLLTLRARIRNGNADAAAAAWQGLARNTGRTIPAWLARWGERSIRWSAGRRRAGFDDARQAVSPL